MAKNNIVFDEGYKEFNINGDPSRTINFNPADASIIERLNNVRKEIGQKVAELDSMKSEGDELGDYAKIVEEANKLVKDMINSIFNADVADVVFGKQSPLSNVNGKTLAERFLTAVVPIIQAEIDEQEKKSRTKVEKYTKKVK